MVSKCVVAGLVADTLICMGGDHSMIDVVRLVKNQRRPVKVVVIGVSEATAWCLKKSADEFINLPVISKAAAALCAGNPGLVGPPAQLQQGAVLLWNRY